MGVIKDVRHGRAKRSYVIETKGRLLIRNRRVLRPIDNEGGKQGVEEQQAEPFKSIARDRTRRLAKKTRAGLSSLNELTVQAVAKEIWRAFHSQDGPDGSRNALGQVLFSSNVATRSTRSEAAGVVSPHLPYAANTLVDNGIAMWNKFPALREASTKRMASNVAKRGGSHPGALSAQLILGLLLTCHLRGALTSPGVNNDLPGRSGNRGDPSTGSQGTLKAFQERERIKEEVAKELAEIVFTILYDTPVSGTSSLSSNGQSSFLSRRGLAGQGLDYALLDDLITSDMVANGGDYGSTKLYAKKSLDDNDRNKRIRFHQCYFNPISCFNNVGGEENLAEGVPRAIRPILTVEGSPRLHGHCMHSELIEAGQTCPLQQRRYVNVVSPLLAQNGSGHIMNGNLGILAGMCSPPISGQLPPRWHS
eukprot:maker-scaffold1088_size63410-snap-gene-0.16 protein:Tk04828 transcript:maker-scaffold1088_size63410-snap-gene-0.16-mRNA-1 annotation:"hypothetical protein"